MSSVFTNGRFSPGAPLTAAGLNRVADDASKAQLSGPGYLQAQNGTAVVPRSPRRALSAPHSSLGRPPQLFEVRAMVDTSGGASTEAPYLWIYVGDSGTVGPWVSYNGAIAAFTHFATGKGVIEPSARPGWLRSSEPVLPGERLSIWVQVSLYTPDSLGYNGFGWPPDRSVVWGLVIKSENWLTPPEIPEYDKEGSASLIFCRAAPIALVVSETMQIGRRVSIDQLHTGPLSISAVTVDEDSYRLSVSEPPDPYCGSIGRDAQGNLQLLGFDGTRRVLQQPLEILPEALEGAFIADIVIRHKESPTSMRKVRYMPLSSFVDYIKKQVEDAGDIPETPPYEEDLQNLPCIPGEVHLYLYDPCDEDPVGAGNGHWKDVFDYVWKKGGNQVDNYGSAVGNSQREKIIDLDNLELKGPGWSVKNLNVEKLEITIGDAVILGISDGPLYVGQEIMDLKHRVGQLENTVAALQQRLDAIESAQT